VLSSIIPAVNIFAYKILLSILGKGIRILNPVFMSNFAHDGVILGNVLVYPI
jgi:hypothetical protein